MLVEFVEDQAKKILSLPQDECVTEVAKLITERGTLKRENENLQEYVNKHAEVIDVFDRLRDLILGGD